MQRRASAYAQVRPTSDVLGRLNALLAHARQNVPYYAEVLAGLGATRLRHIPILTRELLQTRALDLVARDKSDRRLHGRDVRIRSTSGSSGAPAHHFQADREAAIDAGLLLRLHRELGLPASGHLFDLGLHYAGRALLETRIVPGAYTCWNLRSAHNGGARLEYAAALSAVTPTLIYGAASRLQEFANYVLKQRDPVRPRVVLSSYEQLTSSGRDMLNRAFGCPVRSVYGSSELGYCAWECAQGKLHVQADYLLPEIVDHHGQSVPQGEAGRLILTSLKSWLMPLIRYDTGDIAALRIEPCPCGSAFPVLDPFEGRRAAYLYTHSGRAASPYKIMSLIDRLGVARYQIVQRELGAADLLLEATDEAVDVSGCETAISVFLGEAFRLHKKPGSPFTYTPSGKLNPVLSLLKPEERGAQLQEELR